MARYIDADAFKRKLIIEAFLIPAKKKKKLDFPSLVGRVLDEMPTAGVAPKSEVASILDELMKEAREISDRYKKSADETSDFEFERIEFRGCQMGALLVLFKIAELKNKYTGEQI